MESEKKAGPFPLTVREIEGGKFLILTAQGNHYAETFDPSAAKLIAAGPALLKSAESALADWEAGDDVSDDTMERTAVALRASIALAEGR